MTLQPRTNAPRFHEVGMPANAPHELFFNIHGLLAYHFIFRHATYGRYFAHEYMRYRVPALPEELPRLTFYLDCGEPADDEKPELSRRDHYLGFHYRYEVVGLHERHTRVYYHGDWAVWVNRNVHGVLLQASVIEPLVHWKMLRQNVLMMHSAGIASQGRAAVMPACGGTGKTTTCLSLAQDGMELLGDDFVFISDNGQVYGYLRPLHLFNYVLKGLPFLKLSPGVRAAIRGRNLLRLVLTAVTGEPFCLATRVHLATAMPQANCRDQASLGPLVLLTRTGEACRQHDITTAAGRRDFTERLRPTMELSLLLRTELLRERPDLQAMADQLEHPLLERLLQRAAGCFELNCRHPDNALGAGIRRLLA